MSPRRPILAVVVALLAGCDVSYVVVRVDDPLGLARDATELRVGAKDNLEARALPGELPETYAARGAPGQGTVQVAEALGPGGQVLARGSTQFSFPESGSGTAVIVLSAPCADDLACDDGLFANGIERCEDGACAAGEPCPASPIACVDVVADEVALQCVPTPVHERCEPVEGTDGNLEETYCDVRLGCVLGEACSVEEEGALCPRIDPCAPDFVCLAGRCVTGAPIDLDDENPCTLDVCDAQAGPVNIPDPSTRGNTCPLGDGLGICLAGECAASLCGDGYVDLAAGEECDDGEANSDTAPDACREDCTSSRCGDGVTNLGEDCDDANDVEEDSCRSSCDENVCGDGLRDPAAEDCDDGNNDPFDACLPGCVANRCGDGFRDPGAELCDDGNTESGDGCSDDCDFVVWSVDLGESIPGAPIAWAIDEEVPVFDAGPADGGTVTETVSRPLLGALTSQGELIALNRDDGSERWRYSPAGATVGGAPAVGANHISFVTSGGAVHSVPLDGNAQGVDVTQLATTSGALGLGVGAGGNQPRDIVVAIDDDGTIYDHRSDGTAGQFTGSPLGSPNPYPHATSAGLPCNGCVPTITNAHFNGASNMGVIVPLGDQIWWWNFRGVCPAEQLDLNVGESVVRQVVFASNGGASLDPGEAFYAATSEGRLLKATIDNNFGTICAVPPFIVYTHQSPSPITAPPAVVPSLLVEPDSVSLDGFAYYGAADGRLDRLRPEGARSGPPWPYEAGAGLLHTPTIDTELTVYIGDDTGVLHAVQGQTAAQLWTLDLGASLSGSPLVSEDLVYATTTTGLVFALERGGEPLNAAGAWARDGRNNRGSGQSSDCEQVGVGNSSFLLLGVLWLLWRRRR